MSPTTPCDFTSLWTQMRVLLRARHPHGRAMNGRLAAASRTPLFLRVGQRFEMCEIRIELVTDGLDRGRIGADCSEERPHEK